MIKLSLSLPVGLNQEQSLNLNVSYCGDCQISSKVSLQVMRILEKLLDNDIRNAPIFFLMKKVINLSLSPNTKSSSVQTKR